MNEAEFNLWQASGNYDYPDLHKKEMAMKSDLKDTEIATRLRASMTQAMQDCKLLKDRGYKVTLDFCGGDMNSYVGQDNRKQIIGTICPNTRWFETTCNVRIHKTNTKEL